MRFEDKAIIHAPVDVVWQLTEAVENWPEITPTMDKVEFVGDGAVGVGGTARVKQPGRRAAIWTITQLEVPRVFEWQTAMPGATMTARHELTSVSDGTENVLIIELNGFAAGIVGRLAGRGIRKAIATENAAFKRHAEAMSPMGQ